MTNDEKNLPCPHMRASWKCCPHCLGINQTQNDQEKEWWVEKWKEVFRLCEIEHSCCLEEGEAERYSEWLIAEAERRMTEKVEGIVKEELTTPWLDRREGMDKYVKGRNDMVETIFAKLQKLKKQYGQNYNQ